jgi:hypothetical protein
MSCDPIPDLLAEGVGISDFPAPCVEFARDHSPRVNLFESSKIGCAWVGGMHRSRMIGQCEFEAEGAGNSPRVVHDAVRR